jgi:hypothetical protein
MKSMFDYLMPFMKSHWLPQRVVACTVFAEFIAHAKGQAQGLLPVLVNCMMSSLADPVVKFHALRGLGNIVHVGIDLANKYAPTVLDALLCSIDDANESIAMEAMNGLAKVFAIVQEERMSPILINICHRIRPAFDKVNATKPIPSAHLNSDRRMRRYVVHLFDYLEHCIVLEMELQATHFMNKFTPIWYHWRCT